MIRLRVCDPARLGGVAPPQPAPAPATRLRTSTRSEDRGRLRPGSHLNLSLGNALDSPHPAGPHPVGRQPYAEGTNGPTAADARCPTVNTWRRRDIGVSGTQPLFDAYARDGGPRGATPRATCPQRFNWSTSAAIARTDFPAEGHPG